MFLLIRPWGIEQERFSQFLHLLILCEKQTNVLAKEKTHKNIRTGNYVCWLNFLKTGRTIVRLPLEHWQTDLKCSKQKYLTFLCLTIFIYQIQREIMRKEEIDSGKNEKLETILHHSCFTDIASDLAPESITSPLCLSALSVHDHNGIGLQMWVTLFLWRESQASFLLHIFSMSEGEFMLAYQITVKLRMSHSKHHQR